MWQNHFDSVLNGTISDALNHPNVAEKFCSSQSVHSYRSTVIALKKNTSCIPGGNFYFTYYTSKMMHSYLACRLFSFERRKLLQIAKYCFAAITWCSSCSIVCGAMHHGAKNETELENNSILSVITHLNLYGLKVYFWCHKVTLNICHHVWHLQHKWFPLIL